MRALRLDHGTEFEQYLPNVDRVVFACDLAHMVVNKLGPRYSQYVPIASIV